jgi:hypothetical protein
MTFSRLRPLLAQPGYLVFVALLVFCLVGDFFIARGQVPNSDFVQNYREIFAIRDGNLLLKHWVLASDDFYFTDLPFYLFVSLFIGTSLAITYLAPFLIFACLLVTALLIAGRATANHHHRLLSLFAILFLFGTPFSPCAVFLLDGAIHNGTILFALLLVLIAQPALSGNRFNRATLIPFAAIAFAIMASDPLGLMFCILPLLSLLLLRAWLCRALDVDLRLIIGAAYLAGLLALNFRTLMFSHGGFIAMPAYNLNFVPDLATLQSNINGLRTGMRLLFSSYQPKLGDGPLLLAVAVTRRVTLLAVVLLALRVIYHLPARLRMAGVSQWLVLGAFMLFGLDALSYYFTNQLRYNGSFVDTATRFITPGYIFLCLAAALEVPGALAALRPRWLTLLCLWSAGMAAAVFFTASGLQAAALAAAPPAYEATPEYLLARWLQAAHLGYGVGPYWTAELTQALSQNRVIIDPIRGNQPQTQVDPFKWLCDTSSLDAKRRPQFAIFPPNNGFGLSIADITATYGKPRQIFNIDGFYLMIFAP